MEKIEIETEKEWACNSENYFEVWYNNKALLRHWELRDIQLFALMNIMDMDEQNGRKIDEVISCLGDLIIGQKRIQEAVDGLYDVGGR